MSTSHVKSKSSPKGTSAEKVAAAHKGPNLLSFFNKKPAALDHSAAKNLAATSGGGFAPKTAAPACAPPIRQCAKDTGEEGQRAPLRPLDSEQAGGNYKTVAKRFEQSGEAIRPIDLTVKSPQSSTGDPFNTPGTYLRKSATAAPWADTPATVSAVPARQTLK